MVDLAAHIVGAARGASLDAFAAGLADSRDAVAVIADGVVKDFGHVGVADDAFGNDGGG